MLFFGACASASLALGEYAGRFFLPMCGQAAQLAALAKLELKMPCEAKQFA